MAEQTSQMIAQHVSAETDADRREAAWRAYFDPRAPYLRRYGDDAVAWLRLAFEAGWNAASVEHAGEPTER